MEYVNTCAETRIWPNLQDAEGRTLELEPGETVELDEEIEDGWLKPVGQTASEEPVAAPQPAPTAPLSPFAASVVSTPVERTEAQDAPSDQTPATGEEA